MDRNKCLTIIVSVFLVCGCVALSVERCTNPEYIREKCLSDLQEHMLDSIKQKEQEQVDYRDWTIENTRIIRGRKYVEIRKPGTGHLELKQVGDYSYTKAKPGNKYMSIN